MALITVDTVANYTLTNYNISIQNYINELLIQSVELYHIKPLLTDDLYYDFIRNYTDTGYSLYDTYQLLLKGGNWTNTSSRLRKLQGIEKCLSLFVLERALYHIRLRIVSQGILVNNPGDQNSQPATLEEVDTLRTMYGNDAKELRDEITEYLDDSSLELYTGKDIAWYKRYGGRGI